MAIWPVIIPLLASTVLAAAGGKVPRAVSDGIAIAAAAASAIFALLLLRHAPVVYWFSGFAPRGSYAIGIDFAIDRYSAALAAISGGLAVCALVFARRSLEAPEAAFQALVLLFLAGIVGFAFAGDLFDLFVFFELMGAAAYGMCGYKSRERGPLQGALNFAITNTGGAVLTLCGIALLYARAGTLNFSQFSRALHGPPDALVAAAFALVCTGMLVKAAIVPFQFWLADAHAAAPTPACILFSGVMVEAGLYAVARIYGAAFSAAAIGDRASVVLLVAGAITCAAGGILCFAQRHLKRLLAFSTISHSGAMLMGIAALDPRGLSGSALYMAGHACAKAALFLCAGMLLHKLGSVDEIGLRARGRDLPWLGALMAVGGLMLSCVPFSSMSAGEGAIAHALQAHVWAKWVLHFGAILTAAAVLRACGRIFLGWGPAEPDAPGPEAEDEKPEPQGPLTPSLWLPAVALLAAAIASCWLPHEASLRTATRMFDGQSWAAQVLDQRPPALAPRQPLEKEDPWPGIVSALASLALAAATLFRKALPDALRRAVAAIWNPLAGGLRELHTGHVSDQIAWLTLGAALFGGCMLLLR